MNGFSGPGGSASALGSPEEWEPASPIVMPGHAEPTSYDNAYAIMKAAEHLLKLGHIDLLSRRAASLMGGRRTQARSSAEKRTAARPLRCPCRAAGAAGGPGLNRCSAKVSERRSSQ